MERKQLGPHKQNSFKFHHFPFCFFSLKLTRFFPVPQHYYIEKKAAKPPIRSSTAFIHPFILYCFSAFNRKTTSRDRLSRLSVKQKNVRSRDINTCLFAKFKGNTAEDNACQQVLSDPELHG